MHLFLAKIIGIALMVSFFTGCVISYMDKPWPYSHQLWRMDGKEVKGVEADLVSCSQEGVSNYSEAPLSRKLDYRNYCMLRKGYEFVNNPAGRPYCTQSSYTWDENLICQYHRGNIRRLIDGSLAWSDGRVVDPDEFMR